MTGVGRPTSYRPEFAAQAEKLCRLGATDRELAEFFEVCEATINTWKAAQPGFLESLKSGKGLADAEVADKLYRRATGYSHEAVKIFNDGGTPLVVPYTEHYPPDTTAAIFWLKNRRPDRWRDVNRQEHTGKDGGPIETAEMTVEAKAAALAREQAATKAILDAAFGKEGE